MKRLFSSRSALLATFLLAATFTACDFQAAEDAFDDFNVILGLDPINTVITASIYESNSGESVSAELTFSGPNASSLIDAYSDPIGTSKRVDEGILTFGIINSITPTESNPFEFTVTASKEGYYSNTKTFRVRETGSFEFEFGMVREVDATSSVAGTAAVQDNSAQTDASGTIQQSVTIQTQPSAGTQSQAQASVSIPQGVQPVTSSGQPLTGNLTTKMRVYDPGQGQSSLPQSVTQAGDGTNQSVATALYFKMTDASGNVAAGFTSSSGKRAPASKSGSCTTNGGVFEVTLDVTDASVLGAYTLLGALNADVKAYTPADGANVLLGTIALSSDGMKVTGTICVGGTESNVDETQIGDQAQGVFFALVLSDAGLNAPLVFPVTIDNQGGSAPASIVFSGPGIYAQRNITVVPGLQRKTIEDWFGLSGDYFVLSGVNYDFEVTVGSTVKTQVINDPTQDVSIDPAIELPATTGLTAYDVTVSLSCDNPQTEKFEVLVDQNSLDAVSVSFRRADTFGERYQSIPSSAILSRTPSDAVVTVTGKYSFLPGVSYDFKGELDGDVAYTDFPRTPPAGTTDWDIDLLASEVGFDCKDR